MLRWLKLSYTFSKRNLKSSQFFDNLHSAVVHQHENYLKINHCVITLLSIEVFKMCFIYCSSRKRDN